MSDYGKNSTRDRSSLQIFNKENEFQTSQPSQPLPCKIMTKSKPYENEIKRFKKTIPSLRNKLDSKANDYNGLDDKKSDKTVAVIREPIYSNQSNDGIPLSPVLSNNWPKLFQAKLDTVKCVENNTRFRNPLANISSANVFKVFRINSSTKISAESKGSIKHCKLQKNVKRLQKNNNDPKLNVFSCSEFLEEQQKKSFIISKSSTQQNRTANSNFEDNFSFPSSKEKFKFTKKRSVKSDSEKEVSMLFEFPAKRLSSNGNSSEMSAQNKTTEKMDESLFLCNAEIVSPVLTKRKKIIELSKEQPKERKSPEQLLIKKIENLNESGCVEDNCTFFDAEQPGKTDPCEVTPNEICPHESQNPSPGLVGNQHSYNSTPVKVSHDCLSPILGKVRIHDNLSNINSYQKPNSEVYFPVSGINTTSLVPILKSIKRKSAHVSESSKLSNETLSKHVNNEHKYIKELLSPVLDSSQTKSVVFTSKKRQCPKTNLSIWANKVIEETFSPIFDSSQYKGTFFSSSEGQCLKTGYSICNNEVVEEPASPILDSSQYRKIHLLHKEPLTQTDHSKQSSEAVKEPISPILDFNLHTKKQSCDREKVTFNKEKFSQYSKLKQFPINVGNNSALNTSQSDSPFYKKTDIDPIEQEMCKRNVSLEVPLNFEENHLSLLITTESETTKFNLEKSKANWNPNDFMKITRLSSQNVDDTLSPILDCPHMNKQLSFKLKKKKESLTPQPNLNKFTSNPIETITPIVVKKIKSMLTAEENTFQTTLLNKCHDTPEASATSLKTSCFDVNSGINNYHDVSAAPPGLVLTPYTGTSQLELSGGCHSATSEDKSSLKIRTLRFAQDENTPLGPMLASGNKDVNIQHLDFEIVKQSVVCVSTLDSKLCSNNGSSQKEKYLSKLPSLDSELDISNFPIDMSQIADHTLSPVLNNMSLIQERQKTSNNRALPILNSKVAQDSISKVEVNSPTMLLGCQKPTELNSNLCQSDSSLVSKSVDFPTLQDYNHDRITNKSNGNTPCNLDENPNVFVPEKLCEGLTTRTPESVKNKSQPRGLMEPEGNGDQKVSDKDPHEVTFKTENNKKIVKTKLSLFYEGETSIENVSTEGKNESNIIHANENEVNDTIISGVQKLSDDLIEELDPIKSAVECGLQGKEVHFKEPTSPRQEKSYTLIPVEGSWNDTSSNDQNSLRNKCMLWKNQKETFETNYDIVIEDFDEENSCNKNENEISVNHVRLNSVKRNLSYHFEQTLTGDKTNKTGKVSDVRRFQLNFKSGFESVNPCDVSSEESMCDPDIQEEFSQESVKSQVVKIECSTSPTTKSSEGTQEGGSGTLSFPPALNVAASIPATVDILDSACKRKTRVKKGSLVERLRRLIRGQKAEVNMFQHEGAPRHSMHAVSLHVHTVVRVCSLLALSCRHADTHHSNPEELSLGEEAFDPEVRVFVDPSYAKNLTSGSTILIYPRWQSVWVDRRGLMMYNVTKLQLIGSILPPLLSPLLPVPSQEFSCQEQNEECECSLNLMNQLFALAERSTEDQGNDQSSWAEGSVMAALGRGRFPHYVSLKLTILHHFNTRCQDKQVFPSMLCLDTNGHICQLNLQNAQDETKLRASLKDSNTLLVHKLTIFKRVHIDRSKGLRSILSQLLRKSVEQQFMYVLRVTTDWTSEPVPSTLLHQNLVPQTLLLDDTSQKVEGRVRVSVRVMAVRGLSLYVWDKCRDSYFKINVTTSAVLPNFAARSLLDILYLWAHRDEFTLDKFSVVTVLEENSQDSPVIPPPLSLHSIEGDLVLLDSVVTKVDSEMYVRWEGECGHFLRRLHRTLFYCVLCAHTVSSCQQRFMLEVSVAVPHLVSLIRLKVKSETAETLLAGKSGHVLTNKTYNMIGVIGVSLKCLAVVLEVLQNPFGDILEFLLEEL